MILRLVLLVLLNGTRLCNDVCRKAHMLGLSTIAAYSDLQLDKRGLLEELLSMCCLWICGRV